MTLLAAGAGFVLLVWLLFAQLDAKKLLGLIAVLILLLVAAVASAERPQPALIVVCASGGVINHGPLIANAADCVGHDIYGGTFSAKALAIFSDEVQP